MSTYLLLLAVAPAIALMVYIWNKDKSKEPLKMLLILVALGAASCLPAALIELAVGKVIEPLASVSTMFYHLVEAFFGVALIEEGCKFIVMYLYTRNHKDFNGLFDGMIYAVFTSLGFAALENVMYVFEGGVENAIGRALTAVPGHMFFGVFMGYNYSLWHTYKLCDESEAYFAQRGMIIPRAPKYSYTGYFVKAIVLPVLIHGFYDFCLFTENSVFTIVYLIFLVGLYIFCFGRIKKLSKADMDDYQLIPLMLCQKYPELIGIIAPRQANPMAMPNSYYDNRYNTAQQQGYSQPQPQYAQQPAYQQQQQYSYQQQQYPRQQNYAPPQQYNQQYGYPRQQPNNQPPNYAQPAQQQNYNNYPPTYNGQ